MISLELNLLQNIVVPDHTPPFKAASDQGLHYFQRRIYVTPAFKAIDEKDE